MSELTEFPLTTAAQMPEADWTAKNPELAQFQMGIESDTGKCKVNFGPPTRWNSLGYWNPSGAEVSTTKVYRALLTQSGTDAPVATVLENSLGGTVVWTRIGPGDYAGTLAGAFPATKTFVLVGQRYNDDISFTALYRSGRGITDDAVRVSSVNITFDTDHIACVQTDDLLAATAVQILVYP